MKIKFSIIIPVYNVRKYLNQAIESVIEQSYSNLELILIDDGSTDGSHEVCTLWKSKDQRIMVYHQKNSGAAAARNFGIKMARGDYVIFLDGDDWWKSSTVLEKIAKRLELYPVDVLSFNFQKSYDGVLTKPYFNEETFDWTKANGSMNYLMNKELWISSPCNKAICLKVLQDNSIYFRVGISAEDIDWCCRLAVYALKFDYLNENVFIYRQRADSVSHTSSVTKVICFWENVKECLHILDVIEKEKADILRPYISYQYGVFLQLLSALKKSKEKERLIKEAKNNVYLLSFSNNKKIKILYRINSIGGMGLMLKLLWLKSIQRK